MPSSGAICRIVFGHCGTKHHPSFLDVCGDKDDKTDDDDDDGDDGDDNDGSEIAVMRSLCS
jgi:hypothetical protein